MNNYRVLVSSSGENSRKNVCSLLIKKGYKVYEATDGAGALRITRTIFPDLVIIDTNLLGMNPYEVGKIIEEGKLSTVIFISNGLEKDFFEKLSYMNVFAYIVRPINSGQLYRAVEFSIINGNKIKLLENKIRKLESSLKGRKKLDRAKGILIEIMDINEDEAYKYLRKKSMDSCASIEEIAEKIIRKYNKPIRNN